MIKEKDIFISSCGHDDKGFGKSFIKIETAIVSEDVNNTETIDSIILDTPSVNVCKTRAFTMIDLCFRSNKEEELIDTINLLSSFCSVENTFDEEKGEMPAICVSICPKEYNGEYVIVGMHAMWTLHQSMIDGGLDTVRFIVENGFIHTYKIDMDELNI